MCMPSYPHAHITDLNIHRRIAAVPPFPGLRRFPEGRGFKQWTGDDSKALMKVRLVFVWLSGIYVGHD